MFKPTNGKLSSAVLDIPCRLNFQNISQKQYHLLLLSMYCMLDMIKS